MTATGGISINYGKVELTVTVASNNDGTLSVTEVKATDPTATGGTDITSPFIDGTPENVVLKFVNTYSETGTFQLYLTKTLKGREWTDEEFTFIITPDAATLAAIDKGELVLDPKIWKRNTDGKTYTVTINNDNSTDVTEELKTTPWTTRKLDLGELVVTTPRPASEAYKFTIKEEESENLACVQPNIDLNITATSDGNSAGVLTFTATYAIVDSDTTIKTTDGSITLPFTNADTRLGTITVTKVVRDQPADERFTFTLTLTAPTENNLLLVIDELNITISGGEITKGFDTSTTDGTYTMTFELKHNGNLLIENVPYGTEYKVTEDVPDKFHLQEVKDKDNKALTLLPDGNGVNGEVTTENNNIVLEFVNSRFYDMPFTGGAGVHPWVILGIMLMVLPPTIYLFYRKKRKLAEGSHGPLKNSKIK